MSHRDSRMPFSRRQLRFAPLAWLKLQYFCHAGPTEVAGFGVTARHDCLYVVDFVTVPQFADPAFVAMDDAGVADFTDQCIDQGLALEQFLRIWCHTHPGSSAEPSAHDEDTFARVFGSCHWAIMFILSRTAQTYARLSLNVGPGSESLLPVAVDWSGWPSVLAGPHFRMAELATSWQAEFATNVQTIEQPWVPRTAHGLSSDWNSWPEVDRESNPDPFLMEELESYAPFLSSDNPS